MNATGIVRRIDDLGRVVIPKEMRRKFKIREGDPLELFTTDKGIVFQKYSYASDCMDAIENCGKALTAEGIQNAWYDRYNKIHGARCFPDTAPDYEMCEYFEANDVAYFPIVNNGDMFGYVAVSSSDAISKKDVIKAIVRVAANFAEF